MAKINKVNIYNFIVGTKTYLYTNHDKDIVCEGQLYKASLINRSDILSTVSDDKAPITVSMTHTKEKPNEVAKYFKNGMPYNTITLSIREIRDTRTPDIVNPLWFGEVSGLERELNIATFNCNPLSVLLTTRMTRRTYQSNCNNFLYVGKCGLNIEDFKFTATVLEIKNGGTTLKLDKVIPVGGDPVIYKLKAGIATTSENENKMIISVDDALNEITMLTRFSQVMIGDEISIAPGCDRTSDRCKELNNFNNFDGFEFVPNRNKFTAN